MSFLRRVCPQTYMSQFQSMRIVSWGFLQSRPLLGWSIYGSVGQLLSGSWRLSLRLTACRPFHYWSESWANSLTEAEF